MLVLYVEGMRTQGPDGLLQRFLFFFFLCGPFYKIFIESIAILLLLYGLLFGYEAFGILGP